MAGLEERLLRSLSRLRGRFQRTRVLVSLKASALATQSLDPVGHGRATDTRHPPVDLLALALHARHFGGQQERAPMSRLMLAGK